MYYTEHSGMALTDRENPALLALETPEMVSQNHILDLRMSDKKDKNISCKQEIWEYLNKYCKHISFLYILLCRQRFSSSTSVDNSCGQNGVISSLVSRVINYDSFESQHLCRTEAL